VDRKGSGSVVEWNALVSSLDIVESTWIVDHPENAAVVDLLNLSDSVELSSSGPDVGDVCQLVRLLFSLRFAIESEERGPEDDR